jgi:ABC-2 type transport system ATP-binding protein
MNRTIVVDGLVKRFGDFTAVDEVSFAVDEGEVFGFLGPNGAGKSTTVSILTTLSLPSGGAASVGGFDVVQNPGMVRRIAGVALQDVGIDPLMKSRELLRLQARLFGMDRQRAASRADELLELVGLSEFTNRKVGKYSGGMRRRLDLALALVHEPAVLFLDEPTTGLDPMSRRDVWEEVRRLNRERGMTIFLTTQYLEEADRLGDRIAIIDAGRIVAEGRPEDLKAQVGREAINLTFDEREQTGRADSILAGVSSNRQIDGRTLRIYLSSAPQAVPRISNLLTESGLFPSALTVTQPSLDDVFLNVTGQRYVPEEATA